MRIAFEMLLLNITRYIRSNSLTHFFSYAAFAFAVLAATAVFFISDITTHPRVNGKTAGDGKVTGTIIDFLLTDYFVERITANTFSTCRLLAVWL